MTVLSVPLHHKYPLYCTDISSYICYQSCSTVLIVHTAICRLHELIIRFTPQSVTHTTCVICELLTKEPEGGCDTIPFETFKELYTHHAQ